MTKEIPPADQMAESGNYKWKALLIVAMGSFMAAMDVSITNIAFPELTRVFNTGITTVMWVGVAYILVSISSMLILGKISDIIGRKTVYVVGMLIFSLGLIACSVSMSMGQLIFSRGFQGLGAAMIISCGTAVVTESFPLNETGRSLGLLGVAVSLGFIIGPVLGGFLLDWLDWRSIFYVRIPAAFLCLIFGIVLLKENPHTRRALGLDLSGALTSFLGIFFLVYGVSLVKASGSFSPWTYVFAGSGILLLVLFTLLERSAKDPIVDLSLFKDRTFLVATLCLFFNFVSIPPFILIMPFYLMEGIGISPSVAGLLLAVNSVATMVWGPASGALSDRFGAARFAAAGAIAIAAAFSFMLFLDLGTGMATIVSILALLGSGFGMFQAPNSSMIMGAVPRNRLGTASALLATVRQAGISLGMALAGSLYASRLIHHQSKWTGQGIESTEAARLSIPPAFHDTLIVSVLLGIVVIFLCFLDKKKRVEEAV